MNLQFDLLTSTIKEVLVKYKNILDSHNYTFPNGSKEYIILQQNLETTTVKTTIIIDYNQSVIYSTDTTGQISMYFLNSSISYKSMQYIISTLVEDLQKSQQQHPDISSSINVLIKSILKVEFIFTQYMLNQNY